MTIRRRLGAMGSLWIVLVAGTASVAAAGEPAAQPPAGCRTLAFLGLPCELALPPVPVISLPLQPGGTELLPPQLTDGVDELLSSTEQLPAEVAALTESLPVNDILTLTEPLPVAGLLQPVTALIAAPAADEQAGSAQQSFEPTVNGTSAEPALSQATASTDAGGTRVEDSSKARRALTTLPAGGGATRPPAASTSRRGQDPEAASVGGTSGRIGGGLLPVASQPDAAMVALALALGGGASLAVELARGGGGGFASVIAFNVWLRRQLRETRMSQRQLAAFSGVDHSTISRLMSGERAPSLATATKLTKALHKLGGSPHAGDYFARLAEARELPTRRVEAALLGDEELDDEDVRALMHAYVLARARRSRQRAADAENGGAMPSEGPRPA